MFFSGDYFACVHQSIGAELASMWLGEQKYIKNIVFPALKMSKKRSNFVRADLKVMEKLICYQKARKYMDKLHQFCIWQ